MNNSTNIPAIITLKQQAKRLRIRKKAAGEIISHSKSLELIALKYDCRDWNFLSARAKSLEAGCPFNIGSKVSGHYLGKEFVGTIKSLAWEPPVNQTKVSIEFDDAIDVVKFDSFSAHRKRVQCTLDQEYKTLATTSNSQPVLTINL